ncbi:hypothetical protein [Planktothricoides raciborskii]|uniref:Uncharacterized protein n=2 Tax=Planktothricoides raciborskii TaxID=132608 RepID=A0ABR8EEG8_9CYAN|nr:hypothetical protein [Planktothricoides raciborskii]MBD2544975.1 hypothetical protein [Planktothricoides raciborskii FACHB-1370]MBD2584721.1 hypothetical protein [Planktothricoides raciborskii FACHB-1261]
MQNIQLKAQIGEDGILKVQMPEEVKNTQLEVLVVFQPTTIPQEGKTAISQGWPPDFFDKTWGSCANSPVIIDEAGVSAELDDKLEEMFTS